MEQESSVAPSAVRTALAGVLAPTLPLAAAAVRAGSIDADQLYVLGELIEALRADGRDADLLAEVERTLVRAALTEPGADLAPLATDLWVTYASQPADDVPWDVEPELLDDVWSGRPAAGDVADVGQVLPAPEAVSSASDAVEPARRHDGEAPCHGAQEVHVVPDPIETHEPAEEPDHAARHEAVDVVDAGHSCRGPEAARPPGVADEPGRARRRAFDALGGVVLGGTAVAPELTEATDLARAAVDRDVGRVLDGVLTSGSTEPLEERCVDSVARTASRRRVLATTQHRALGPEPRHASGRSPPAMRHPRARPVPRTTRPAC
ncbi:hypothetical protein [Actinomycetospora aeridis]|uniref:DUF222 domain-containing protein n=1 Tax=Actinomycetospora aeridis TaxID=3129231 RepID=A0ABU8N678_9PSEU